MSKPKISPAQHIYDRMIYDAASPIAEVMLKVDSQWFRDHPDEKMMFRQAVDGESPILDLLRARGEGDAFWLLVEKTDDKQLLVRPIHEQNGVRMTLHSAQIPLSETTPFFDLAALTNPEAETEQEEAHDVIH